MNKRQAKKAFKKKFGVNPAEYEKQMDLALEQISKTIRETDWQEIGRILAENMTKAIKDLTAAVCDGVKSISDMMNTPELKEALEKYRKEQEEKDVY